MPPSPDTLHLYVDTLLMSAVCTSVAADWGLWSVLPMVHTYMGEDRPVDVVPQVKVKEDASVTGLTGLLVMLGVSGKTAHQAIVRVIFSIQVFMECI